MVDYIKRSIAETIASYASEFPVLTIFGPRQSGKTTLVKELFPSYKYVNLELPDARLLAETDPNSFLELYSAPVIIDEIQRVPLLLSYIQVLVDANRKKKAQFILTGSQQMELHAAVSQSLAGRTAILRLLPLSMQELSARGIELPRNEQIFRGFMPGLYSDPTAPERFYSSYYQTYVERDIRQIANIHNMRAFENFIKLLAGRVGQLVNLSDLANSTGMSSTTLAGWLTILEASFIIFRLPPYFENFNKRIIKSAKIYFTEPGLAAYLVGITTPDQIGISPFLGGLFENVVAVEALKFRYNQGKESNLYFFRDNNGLEADLLLDSHDKLVPVEIKASQTFSQDFCKNLGRLKKIDDKVADGFLIYAGELETNYKGVQVVNYRNTGNIFNK